MYLELLTSSYSEDTSEADPEDSWSRASTSTSWDVRGIRAHEKDGYGILKADFPVEIGDEVHVVYAVYSTGDSFGHDDGAYLEVLSFHKDLEVAKRNEASVNHGHRNNDERYVMTIEFDSGAKVERYCPWDGYFESLDYVRVESFRVER